jgi:D-alanine-D-alanine ligase
MKIGIAYDLRSWYLAKGYSMEETAEFDKESTVEAIEEEIRYAGYEPDKIGNVYNLVERLAAGDRWDLVFNITECLYGDGRESVVPALLDQYKIPYVFSGPVVMGISLNKYYSRLVVGAAGVRVSPGNVVYNREEIEYKIVGLKFPLFLKPVSEGTGKGITTKSIVNDVYQLKSLCEELLNEYHQPVLVEEYMPGREFTVGIVGSGASSRPVGAMEIVCKDNMPYCNEVKENFEQYVEYKLVAEEEVLEECYRVAQQAWIALNGVDAGRIDLRTDRYGKICFIEANPLAGLNPKISDLPILCRMNGVSYRQLLNEIISSAVSRVNK